jgi:carbon monoxide dehydrogenase subunit G
MKVEYGGTIGVPIEQAWSVLSDLERAAACLPGVRLDQINGDEVAGTVTVPLGPLRLTYRGEAAFVERDREARRVVIDAAGRDSHGEQAASARVTVQLREAGDQTEVQAIADVNVRGMSAPVGFAVREFGTGLLREFVTRLGARTPKKASPATAAARDSGKAAASPAPSAHGPSAHGSSAGRQSAPEATASAEEPRRVPQPMPGPSPDPEHAVYPVPPPGEGSAVPPAVAQYAPLASAMAVGVLLGWLLGRRRHR